MGFFMGFVLMLFSLRIYNNKAKLGTLKKTKP